MYLQVHAGEVDDGVPVQVTGVKDQGSFKILTTHLAGQVIRARLPEDQPVPGDTAWLRFPPEHTKLFVNERLVEG